MKVAKMRQHLTSVHPESVSNHAGLIRANKVQFEKAGTLPELGFAILRKPFLEAYRIAKQKKTHAAGETLVKLGALDMAELVCGLEQRKKLEAVPMSNYVIRSRTVNLTI
jgi:hypothetical protein